MKSIAAILISMFAFHAVPARSATNTTIDSIYAAVHDRVCTEMNVAPCTRLDERNERWAFVAAWCDLNRGAAVCKDLANVTGGPVVIAYHHDSRAWRPLYGMDARDLDVNDNGEPVVLTDTSRVVVPVVESTNPLLYAAEAGAIASADSAVVEALSSFLEKFGPALTGLAGLAEDLLETADRNKIEVARDSIRKIDCALKQPIAVRRFIQRVERGRADSYQFLEMACDGLGSDTIESELDRLSQTRDLELCNTDAAAYKEVLEMPGSDPAAITTKLGEIQPSSDLCKSRFEEFRDGIALEIGSAQWSTFATARRKTIRSLEDAVKIVDTADEFLDETKQTEIKALIGDVERFQMRVLESMGTLDTKAPDQVVKASDIPPFFVVRQGQIPVSWDKDRTRTLTVTKSSPYAEGIVARRPDSLATSYGASSLVSSLVDFNISLTHTQLSSPVFGTISVPDPTDEDPDHVKNVIAKKDEDERSGKLAAFVSYPVLARYSTAAAARRLGVEFGVALDTEDPGVFLGASWKVNRAIRLGVGKTWQQVKTLDGQSIGDTVAAETDIKLENEVDSSWYASFSFSLGSLSLFKE